MTSQTERQRGATQSPSLEGSKPGLDVSPGLSGLPKGRDSGPERPRGYAPPIHFSTGKIHMESSREKRRAPPAAGRCSRSATSRPVCRGDNQVGKRGSSARFPSPTLIDRRRIFQTRWKRGRAALCGSGLTRPLGAATGERGIWPQGHPEVILTDCARVL
jgi:hypothetical protein